MCQYDCYEYEEKEKDRYNFVTLRFACNYALTAIYEALAGADIDWEDVAKMLKTALEREEKIYVILDTDHFSRPVVYHGLTTSKKKAEEYKKQGFTVKEECLSDNTAKSIVFPDKED